MKAKKYQFITIFLVLMFCLIGAVSATEDISTDTPSTTTADQTVSTQAVHEDLSEKVSSTTTKTVTDDTPKEKTNKEKIGTTDNTKTNNKTETNTETTTKNTNNKLKAQNNNENTLTETNTEPLKTGTKTVEVNNWNELSTAITNAVQDTENDTYIINLNSGTYSINPKIDFKAGLSTPNIIINANGQTLNIVATYISFENGCNITLNDAILTKNDFRIKVPYFYLNNVSMQSKITLYNNAIVDIQDSILNNTLTFKTDQGTSAIIGNDCIIGEKFKVSGTIVIKTNNSDVIEVLKQNNIYLGDNIISDTNITNKITNYGNLTIKNSKISASISNVGKIIIQNTTIDINGQIISAGDDLIVKNSTIAGKLDIKTGHTIIFEDDVIFEDTFNILGTAYTDGIIINDTNKINPYLPKYSSSGVYIIENKTIGSPKRDNYGDLTFRNSIINSQITNNKNLTIENSTINSQITNNKNLTIENSTINAILYNENNGKITIRNSIINYNIQNFGTLILENITIGAITNYLVVGSGIVIADNINELFPYMTDFTGETVIELGDYNKVITNSGNLTIENSTLHQSISNLNNGKLILKNSTILNLISNQGTIEITNSTINNTITNLGTLIISEDTIIGENFKIEGSGEVITNNTQLIDYVEYYKGNIVLINKTIDTNKINMGTLTLTNCTINATIANNGIINIDNLTIFGENTQITGEGEIVINDIKRVLPYITTIKGNHIISDVSLTKTYKFYGTVNLNNCTITSLNNMNYGILYLNNCTVDVGEDNTFLTNLKTVYVSKDTTINGKLNDLSNGVIYEGAPQTYIINQATIPYYFENGKLNSIINDGDTLDIQGKIILNESLTINKAVNIISSTKDGYIDLNTSAGDYFGSNQGNKFAITKDGAYSNITGVYFHNTQLWIYNTNHVTLDNISVVVENQRIGSGVGVTSIRANSTYITVKNSYFHTTENEGSSTLVLAWADYCTIENNTIKGDGMVGNLLYLTTYNVNIPTDIIYNAHNKLINNTIIGPEDAADICFGICISGFDNIIADNTITYSGQGIAFQVGSGVNGNINNYESLFGSGGNIVRNNKLYGGCGIRAGDIIYNNYMDGTLIAPGKSKAYNNTANGLNVGPNAEVTNNTINGDVTFNSVTKNSILENNNIVGNIEIPATVTNITLKGNEIKGSIKLDGSNNTLADNTIITDSEYTISSNKLGENNNITANYLVAKDKCGDATVDLRDGSNIIKNNIPVKTIIELVGPSEVIVNKPVSITIRLVDANGDLIKDAQVLVSSSNGNETLILTTGTYTYTYTPVSIGEDTVTVKYPGNYTLFKSTNSTTINVIAEPVNPENGTGNKTPEKETSGNTTTQPQTPTTQAPTTTKLDEKAQEALEQKLPAKQISITAKKTTTVSKKAKKLTLKATLKVKGKKVNKRTVKFIIKGKTYKAKTNKKGVATLKLNKKQLTKILKKVKPGKKLTYKIRYGKKTVKKSLKIKK